MAMLLVVIKSGVVVDSVSFFKSLCWFHNDKGDIDGCEVL